MLKFEESFRKQSVVAKENDKSRHYTPERAR